MAEKEVRFRDDPIQVPVDLSKIKVINKPNPKSAKAKPSKNSKRGK